MDCLREILVYIVDCSLKSSSFSFNHVRSHIVAELMVAVAMGVISICHTCTTYYVISILYKNVRCRVEIVLRFC